MLRQIRKLAGKTSRKMPRAGAVKMGIGDDCAILRPPRGHEIVVTTDLNIEGTHFHREWHPAEAVGHRTLARGLSDLASMGAQPLACFLSLGLPTELPQSWVDDFFAGLMRLGARFACLLAGGDLAESGDRVVADVMVVGSVPAGKGLLRSSARPGDIIYVTGQLGGSSASLRQLFSGGITALSRDRDHSRHFYPEPRIEVGRELRERKLANAMIDLSDGLSTDLGHICEESGVGAMLNQLLLPISPGATLEDGLHGGEDYELLFTAPPSRKIPVQIAGVPITEIGWIRRERGIWITDLKSKPKRLTPKGWQHFAGRKPR